MEPASIAVLISGRGSNLEALLKSESKYGYKVAAVLSGNDQALGLAAAQVYAVPTIASFPRHEFPDKASQKHALYEALASVPDVSLVCLAGFMQIVPVEITERYRGKLLNIHPSLLPKYPGLDTHARALEAREAEHGASVHFVDGGVDTGPLIAQAKVAVDPHDTVESLAKRVLLQEHRLYPWVVSRLLRGAIAYGTSRATITAEAQAEGEALGFCFPA